MDQNKRDVMTPSKRKKRKRGKVLLIILPMLLLLAGMGILYLTITKGRALEEALGNSRKKFENYSLQITEQAFSKAVEIVKEDSRKTGETARGLQAAWEAMWPEETEITENNREDFARIQECKIMAEDVSQVMVSGIMEGIPKSDDRRLYLFNLPTYSKGLSEGQEPVASVRKSDDRFQFTCSLNYKQANNRLQDKFAVGIKVNGSYLLLSDSMYITNPEQRASYTYAYPKTSSIKGILVDPFKLKGNELTDLGIKQGAYNILVGRLLGPTSSANYPTINYSYNGKNYQFDGQIVAEYDIVFSRLTQLGIQTTAIILNDWDSSHLGIIHPNARAAGKCHYYMFNAADKDGVDYLGAVATFLAERYSGTKHGQVVNWVIANEINARADWNYYPQVGTEEYTKVYADGFRVFYNAIKSVNACAKIYMPLDQTWNRNLNSGSYDARDVLDYFNAYIKSEGNIDWDLSHHPYPVPLTHAAFWNMPSNYRRMNLISNSADTKMVTIQNIHVVTDYLQREEFLNPQGESRSVILSELGFTSTSGQGIQAAALAYGYKIAEANSHIDGFLLNRHVDAGAELAQGLALGICDAAGNHKQAYQVYKHIDTSKAEEVCGFVKGIIGISSWTEVIKHR
ncbi:MAG: hypothetical protein IKW28_08795 [Lachnospiraceae bacterium]|nr:hypothetical protein [Lachnospiraceae bacterium]